MSYLSRRVLTGRPPADLYEDEWTDDDDDDDDTDPDDDSDPDDDKDDSRSPLLLQRSDQDLPPGEFVATSTTYSNVDAYIRTFRAFVLEEWNNACKQKSHLNLPKVRASVSLDYPEVVSHRRRPKPYVRGVIDFTVPFSHVNHGGSESSTATNQQLELGDTVIMHFDNYGTKCQAGGNLLAIDRNQITASMKFKTGEVRESSGGLTIPCSISFLPPNSVFRRQALGLEKLKERSAQDIIRQTILGQRQPPIRSQKPILADASYKLPQMSFQATPTQTEAVNRALSRPFTLVQGPPGTGKTRMIAAIVFHLLRGLPHSKILVCATSNVAVQNAVAALFRAVAYLGKKLLWLGSANRDVEWSDKLAPEFRTLAYIQMMTDSSPEGERFAELRRILPLRGAKAIEAYVLRQQLEERLCAEADVVCCTLETAARDCLAHQSFPTVIMDEATQALEPSALIPLIYGAERVVLVGDQCQLGPVVCNQTLAGKGYDQSLFERLIRANVDSIMLDRQFRMHPEISAFPNAQFYDGLIQDGVTAEQRLHRIRECFPNEKIPLSFIDHDGDESKIGNSFGNSLEAEIVTRVVCRLLKAGIQPTQIGIITPYRGQVQLIEKGLRPNPSDYPGLKIATVDSFQGSECDYIIMSTVRNGDTIGFVRDTRRMNVSLTRARYGLVIVGHRETLSADSDDWYALCEHFEAKKVLTKELKRSNAALAALMKLGKR